MTHDQAAADRERIAGALHPIASDDKHPQANAACALITLAGIKENGYADARGYRWTIPPTLDAAIDAFEVLCEPRGWRLMRSGIGTWWTKNSGNVRFYAHDHVNHAADVCCLVCEVLDREANPPENQCPECRTLMVRSGRVWKCLNCGTEKEPKHGT